MGLDSAIGAELKRDLVLLQESAPARLHEERASDTAPAPAGCRFRMTGGVALPV